MFKQGDVVQHKLSGSWLTVLKVNDNDELILRTKDFRVVVLYNWEVIKVPSRD